MSKLAWRLVRLFKFLLSFPFHLGAFARKCDVAAPLNRFVSLWRQIQRYATYLNLGSLPPALCSNVPELPLTSYHDHVPAIAGPLTTAPFDLSVDRPGLANSAVHQSATPHTVVEVSNDDAPDCPDSHPTHDDLKDVEPAFADGKIRYGVRKNDGIWTRNLKIPAGRASLTEVPPAGWERFEHPEGNVFFCYEEPSFRVFTDTYITNENGLGAKIVLKANALIKTRARPTDAKAEGTKIELMLNKDKEKYDYYFVDHVNRRLFWHKEVKVERLFGTRFKGVTQLSQTSASAEYSPFFPHDPKGTFSRHPIGNFFSRVTCSSPKSYAFRSHCQYYPYKQPISKAFRELRGLLKYAKADVTTSDSSLSPFAMEELNSLLDIVEPLSDDAQPPDECDVFILGRLMYLFAYNKFVNFHGQECARLDAGQSLFEEGRWQGWSFKVINLFLLQSLKDHDLRLRRVWANRTIILPRWKDFLTQMTNELSRYTIFSTVMLAASLAFLAVPGIPVPTQVIIYGSALMTIASIVVSFTLLSIYANPKFVDPTTTANIMRNLSETKFGIHCLAITHSLPMASLIWSIFLFFVALAYSIFAQADPVVRIIFSVAYFVLLCLGTLSYTILRFFS